jgi:catechol 2,3-dioxygenase-like lactoylglutathione lyase family enzyme
MILYITLGSNDLARSAKFYDAALTPLGYKRLVTKVDEIGYGIEGDHRQCRLWIVEPYLKLPATWGNGTLLALSAPTRAVVDDFYNAAMQQGGIDEGAPGLRPYHASFYAAYVRDPDGNKLSVVCESAE